MRFVAARARTMAERRGVVLPRVTGRARLLLRARVRVVALGAARVARAHPRLLCRVAALTADLGGLRRMGQPAVTTVAFGVTSVHCRLAHRIRVARRADGLAAGFEPEVVRLMAGRALDAAVCGVIGPDEGVARAARRGFGRGRVGSSARGVRVMAADARSLLAVRRVLGMHLAVTARARGTGTLHHGVRRVTAGATLVLADLAGTEHGEVVARAAPQARLRVEVVRAMTIEALVVPSREQGGLRHDRLVSGVTVEARSTSRALFGVRPLVTARAALQSTATGGLV